MLLSLFLANFAARPAVTAPGDVDPGFNPNANDIVYTAVVQPDGKIVIGGSFTSLDETSRNYFARLNADGSLNSGFDPDLDDSVYSTVLQADGKILIAGRFTSLGVNNNRNRIARLNEDGTLDAGFDPNANNDVNVIALQTSGQIVIGGNFLTVGGTNRNRIARLNADGTIDTGFNPNANSFVNTITLQPNGQFIIGGNFTTVGGTNRSRIARLNADGTLDSSFNPGANNQVNTAALQSDGKVLIGGNFTIITNSGVATARSRIARLNADGTLDTDFNPSANNSINSVVVQTDGKIIIGGNFTTITNSGVATARNRIARLNADGTLDTGFNPNADNFVYGVAVQANGQVLMGGQFTGVGAETRNGIARLLNDAATQSLSVPSASRVQWLRGGASPETHQVTFEISTDGGTNYTSLGSGTRISGGWELTGVNLPGSGQVRARARATGGRYNGSSGLVEAVAAFSGLPVPEIAVEHVNTNIADGGSMDFRLVVVGGNTNFTFTITNTGTADLTGLGITIDGADAALFTVTASPVAPVSGPGGSTTFTVRFAPTVAGVKTAALHITSNDYDESPFDITLTGTAPGLPIISDIASQTINEDGNTGALAFTIGDGETAVTNLTLTSSSSNQTLVPNTNIVFGGSGSNRTVTLTPVGNQSGSAIINVTVTDGDGLTASDSFTLTVLSVNDAPSFTKGANLTVNENAGSQTVVGWATAISAGPSAESGQLVDFILGNDNSALFSVPPAIAANGTLTYTAAANANGAATVTVQIHDNGGTTNSGVDTSAAQTFTITVNAVNYAPSGANNTVTTLEDTAYTFSPADFGFTDPNDSPANAFSRVKITTLPSAGTLTVDGIAVNVGDFAVPNAPGIAIAAGATWTARAGSQYWRAVASSADGNKLVAVVTLGQIYTSTDSGVSWTARESSRYWESVASSADGNKLVAVAQNGQIYTSTNSGVNWTARESSRSWSSVASSADGSKLAAVANNGPIYTSTDSGVNWTPRESGRQWQSVASSADGSQLVAVVQYGQIHISTDSGVSWTARESNRNWQKVASSAAGSKLVALVYLDRIYTSTDSGVSWTAQNSDSLVWDSIASSADGSKLIASAYGGNLYTSKDSGVSWTARESRRDWQSVACSSDGLKLVAVVNSPGQIYTSVGSFPLVFTPATNGNGTPYANFTFQVEDDGGTANGSVNLDPVPKTMTIHVTPVNDAPTLPAISPAVILEDAGVQTVNLSGIGPGPDSGQNVTNITASSSNRGLIPDPVVTYTSPSATGSLSYTPVAGSNGTATITVIVTDDGGTANGGVNALTNTFTVTVRSVNDAPTGANSAVTMLEDAGYNFPVADFGFADPSDSPANALSRIKITTLPSAGTLTFDGAPVNAGDFVSPSTFAFGAAWTARASSNNWQSVASSADGTKLVAVDAGYLGNGGKIYTSIDSGVSWKEQISSSELYVSVASSSDGSKLIAADGDGYLWTSTNAGVSWTARGILNRWRSVASSADGNKLVAVCDSLSAVGIYTSTDSGVNWTKRSTLACWTVASSSDGVKLIAAIGNGQIYTSTDSGISWTPRESNRFWTSVASSADGSKLVAVDSGNTAGGRIYISTDSGLSWTARETNRQWHAIASSADGSKLVAAVWNGGKIYTSTDSGVTWTARITGSQWYSVASSADGSKLVAGILDGQLYTSNGRLVFTPAANTNGSPCTTFTFQVEDDGGTANGGVNLDPAPKTMTFNVIAVNDAPTLAAIGNPTVLEDAGVLTVSLSGITAGGGESQALTITASSGNLGLIPNPTVAYTNGNATGSLSYTPVTNANGAATITVIVTDDGGTANEGVNALTNTFTVIVTPVDDAPTLAAINNPAAILENAGLQTVNLSGISAGGGESQVLTITASSSNPGLIPNPTATYTSPNVTGTLSYTPVTNANGTATITVVVTDDGDAANGGVNSTTNTFTVVVKAVADGVGAVDTTFDPNAGGVVYGIAEQPDGKIVVAGNFTTIGASARNYIARLNGDTSLDGGFNPNASTNVYSTAVQADGKIVLGGAFTTVGGVPRNRIARLNADGTLDSNFDPNVNGDVRAVAVLPDGKLLIGGSFTTVGGTNQTGLARLNTNGTLDTVFPNLVVNAVSTLAVQTDERIIIGGSFTNVGGILRNRLARLNSNGTLDNGFNPVVNNQVLGVAVQADGKIIIGGNFTNVGGSSRDFAARLDINGTVDATFANPNADDWIETVAVQADGLILLGGRFTNIRGVARNHMARFGGDGALDNNFNPNVSSSVQSCAVQADGRIIIGGQFTAVGGVSRNRIARLTNDTATSSLTVPNGSRVQWLRGGASPETHQVTFEISTDDGTNYTHLGVGTRITGGWELTGLNLPSSGQIRARARISGGSGGSSSRGLVEAVARFPDYLQELVFPSALPGTTGRLRVTLIPAEAGGQWRFPWEQRWRDSGQEATNLVAGNYAVELRALPGYLTISPSFVVALQTNSAISITNEFLPTIGVDASTAGTLSVNFGPSPPPGAGWRFLGESAPFFPSSFSTNLQPGIYRIEFAPVSGFSKPASLEVQVLANQPATLSVTYLLADSPPGGVLLPVPIPVDRIYDPTNYPFGFNGQLQSDLDYGSGVAVQANVVLTAAHLVFNDHRLAYVSQTDWYHQREAGVFEPKPLAARGWYVLRGYAAQRTNDVLGSLGPDQSSPRSRNLDIAALYFLSPVARGGKGAYLHSDATPNTWLTSTALKILVGYPVDGSQFGDASIVPGKMYQTDPRPDALSIANDPVPDSQQVYEAPWFLSYPGNSGGPLYVQLNGYYYPAAVYLGTRFNGSQPAGSLVRAIDSNVVNLITLAAAQGDSGTNFTGGGVITIIPSQGISSNNPGYVQFRLTPPAAVRAGAGWRLLNDAAYSTATNYIRAVTSTNAFAIEFKPISGWNSPSNQNVTVFPGQIALPTAFYSVSNPLMVIKRSIGIGITGTTGTTYRIEQRSSLTSGTWLPVSTNTINSTGFNLALPQPSTNPSPGFYRLLWLTNF